MHTQTHMSMHLHTHTFSSAACLCCTAAFSDHTSESTNPWHALMNTRAGSPADETFLKVPEEGYAKKNVKETEMYKLTVSGLHHLLYVVASDTQSMEKEGVFVTCIDVV